MSRRAACLLAVALLVGGCDRYRFTYDDAFPPAPVHLERFDPPDSLAFVLPEPPPVAAVIQDAEYYYLLHQPGEEEFKRAMREEAAREQRERARRERERREREAAAAALVAEATATHIDSLEAAGVMYGPPDSLAGTAAAVRAEPSPPVRFSLSEREKEVYRRRAMVDLQRAETLLVLLDDIDRPSRLEREQIRSVRGFVQRAQEAFAREDYLGGSNLALKARALAEDLYESRQ